MAAKEQKKGSAGDLRQLPLESVDDRMIGLMRLILAASALVIIYIDPAEPDRFVALTYLALVLYSFYSAAIYALTLRRRNLPVTGFAHWIDIGWYLLFVALSSGTSSIFFFFFLFAVLVASFRWGFASGLRVAAVSTVLFSTIGYLTAPEWPDFELNRFMLRPVYLLVLGYMIAYWGGSEITMRRRLALLREVSSLSNPRFGAEMTISSMLARLRAFYDADACLLLTASQASTSYVLRRLDRESPGQSVAVEQLAAEAARPLLTLPEQYAGAYSRAGARLWQRLRRFDLHEFLRREGAEAQREASKGLANVLDTSSFATAPVCQRGQVVGRLYVTSQRRTFNHSDAEFLRQVLDQVMPVIENIQLLDHLASEAANQERLKISRDIHDSTIQPYIGLLYGLKALRRRINGADPLGEEVDELVEKTSEGINDLRLYVRELKGEAGRRESILLPAVRRQAERFSSLYGVEVEVHATEEIRVNDRLAAEAFQMVNEGLSNVRRHTRARRAAIHLACADGNLILQIENDNADTPVKQFVPRSITERAAALGGKAEVIQTDDGDTTVSVEIPL